MYGTNHFQPIQPMQRQQSLVRLTYPTLALTQIGLSTQASSFASSPQDFKVPLSPSYNFQKEYNLISTNELKIAELTSKNESRKKAIEEKRKKQEEAEFARIAAEHQRRKDSQAKEEESKDVRENKFSISLAQPVMSSSSSSTMSRSGFSYLPSTTSQSSSSMLSNVSRSGFSYPFMKPSPSSQLDVNQRNLLSNFRVVCQVTEKDDEQSINLLNLVKWDLPRAINVMFENGNSLQAAIAKVNSPPPQQQPVIRRTTIQIQFENGVVSTQDFNYDDTLWTVYEFIARRHANDWGGKGFNLMYANSRQPLTEGLFNQTLQQAGLVPTGILRATKP